MLKKNLVFTIFVLDLLWFVYSVLCLAMPDAVALLGLPIWHQYISIASIVVSLILLPVLGSFYQTVKEREDFNEFGVRKKKAKQKISSYHRQLVEAQQLAETERIVSKAALDKAVHKGSKNPEEDLEKLIGLNEAKLAVKKMAARMDFAAHSNKKTKTKEPMHMVFYGSPGTGKTTVARIVAGFLYDREYIRQNKVFETDGNFLKGGNASDTERKVKMIIDRAADGVLFVDEAYALTQSHDGAGKQAIATLIKEMEDHPDKFVAIFAGYTDEMREMLDTNPGFRSRIKEYIQFPDYEAADLREIAIKMAGEKGFAINAEAFQNFDHRMVQEKKLSSWGNGRTVRNVIEEAVNNHAFNYEQGLVSKSDKYTLTEADIDRVPPKRI